MNNDKLIEAMAIAIHEQAWGPWEEADDGERTDARDSARAALAALQETHAVVPREPVAWRRLSISGRNRWIFAYAREAAHFNQGEWEPLYAEAPQPHAPVAIKELRARRGANPSTPSKEGSVATFATTRLRSPGKPKLPQR